MKQKSVIKSKSHVKLEWRKVIYELKFLLRVYIKRFIEWQY